MHVIGLRAPLKVPKCSQSGYVFGRSNTPKQAQNTENFMFGGWADWCLACNNAEVMAIENQELFGS